MSGSLHMLGATPAKALLVRVQNPGALAASQKGAAGAIASALLPQLVNDQVLAAVKAQLQQKLAENGVEAQIQIVQDTGTPASSQSDLFGGMAIGGGLVGVLWGLAHFLWR